jgi:hypothetical protein
VSGNDLLTELEQLHSRSEEARHRAARAEAAAEHKRAELAEIAQSLKAEYGIEDWEQAQEWLVRMEAEAEQAVARARDLIEAEGI